MTKILYIPEGRYLKLNQLGVVDWRPNFFQSPEELIAYICQAPCGFTKYNKLPEKLSKEEFEIIND